MSDLLEEMELADEQLRVLSERLGQMVRQADVLTAHEALTLRAEALTARMTVARVRRQLTLAGDVEAFRERVSDPDGLREALRERLRRAGDDSLEEDGEPIFSTQQSRQ